MSKQLISIHPDGSVTGLQFKKKGINLQKLGHAVTKRVTDIEWSDIDQDWRIRFLMGTLQGCLLTRDLAKLAGLPEAFQGRTDRVRETCHYEDYDDAVTAEIEFIQRIRLLGKGKLVGEAN
jgi:hypothetical protein